MSDKTTHAVDTLMKDADAKVGQKQIRKMAEELVRRGVDPAELGRLSRMKMYQAVTKDDDGNAHVHDLWGFHLAPSWEAGPEWPVVQPPAPVKISAKNRPKRQERPYKTTVVLPDPQIGYRRMQDTGELIPMQDERAIDVSLQVIRHVAPECVINLGDTMDMSEWTTKFIVSPEFMFTTQAALDRTQTFLADQRANMPADLDDPKPIKKLIGNHDERLALAIAKNAASALRLRKANKPDSWPVMSLQNLLDVDEIGVELSAGYPAGKFKVANGTKTKAPLYAIHGKKLDIVKVAKESRQSYIQGHLHHIAEHHMTYELEDEGVHVVAISAGTLADTKGNVPSYHSGERSDGRPERAIENWQQAVVIVNEWPDGYWTHQIVEIEDGRAVLGDVVFEA